MAGDPVQDLSPIVMRTLRSRSRQRHRLGAASGRKCPAVIHQRRRNEGRAAVCPVSVVTSFDRVILIKPTLIRYPVLLPQGLAWALLHYW